LRSLLQLLCKLIPLTTEQEKTPQSSLHFQALLS